MFVVILTGEAGQVFTAPRAVGPFDDFDAAQKFRNELLAQWEAEGNGRSAVGHGGPGRGADLRRRRRRDLRAPLRLGQSSSTKAAPGLFVGM